MAKTDLGTVNMNEKDKKDEEAPVGNKKETAEEKKNKEAVVEADKQDPAGPKECVEVPGEPTCEEKAKLEEVAKKELEERRKNAQKYMEKLAKIKQDEFKREEASMVPLRHYLMAHVVPTLTKGLIEVTRARPADPVEFLAEFLFQNNPGNISSTGAHIFKTEML